MEYVYICLRLNLVLFDVNLSIGRIANIRTITTNYFLGSSEKEITGGNEMAIQKKDFRIK